MPPNPIIFCEVRNPARQPSSPQRPDRSILPHLPSAARPPNPISGPHFSFCRRRSCSAFSLLTTPLPSATADLADCLHRYFSSGFIKMNRLLWLAFSFSFHHLLIGILNFVVIWCEWVCRLAMAMKVGIYLSLLRNFPPTPFPFLLRSQYRHRLTGRISRVSCHEIRRQHVADLSRHCQPSLVLLFTW